MTHDLFTLNMGIAIKPNSARRERQGKVNEIIEPLTMTASRIHIDLSFGEEPAQVS